MYKFTRAVATALLVVCGFIFIGGQGQPQPIPAGCQEDDSGGSHVSHECNPLLPCNWVSECNSLGLGQSCESCDSENWHFGCQELAEYDDSKSCRNTVLVDSQFCIENHGCGEKFRGTCKKSPTDPTFLICDKVAGLGVDCTYRAGCRDL